jgi:hypothetical protein
MRKKILLVILFIPSLLFAQVPNCLWANDPEGTSAEYGSSVATDASGNVYVTGAFQSPTIMFGTNILHNNGSFDVFVVKYDPYGNVLWAKGAGGTGDDIGYGIGIDPSGNIYVTGYFKSPALSFDTTGLTNTSAGTNDVFIVKYDENGNVLWATGGGGTMDDHGLSITVDDLGNAFITGYFYSSTLAFGTTTLINNGSGTADLFVAKYDGNGNVLWATGAGGSNDDIGQSIVTDASGNAYATGYFYSSSFGFDTTVLINTGAATSDIFVVKYDENGNILWATSDGGSGIEHGINIVADLLGNVYVAGNFNSPTATFDATTLINAGSYDMFIAKYDGNGNVVSATGNGGTGSETVNCIAPDNLGNVFVTGWYTSATLTLGTTILNNAGFYDIFIAKCDGNGNALSATGAGGTGNDEGVGITADPFGNISVTGFFNSSMLTFGTDTLYNGGTFDIFVAKFGVCIPVTFSQNSSLCPGENITVGMNTYSSPGTYIDTLAAANLCDSIVTTHLTINTTYDTIQNITINQGDTVFVGGDFYITQGSYTDTLATINNCDSIITLHLTVLTGFEANSTEDYFSIYPNPSNGIFDISFIKNNEEINCVTLTDLFGQEICSFRKEYLNADKIHIDISDYPAGIYFIHINQHNKINSCKLIKN